MTILYTSLAEILSFRPCASGWRDILKGQKKRFVDSEVFPLLDCTKSNSISDICWLLGKRKVEIDICVKFAEMCAKSVSHLKNNASAAASASANASASASAYANDDAYAYADDDDDAYAYAAYAASAASAYAASAASAAYATSADYDAYAAYAASADYASVQKEKNEQFLIQCIKEYQDAH